MERGGSEMKERRLYDASLSGSVESLHELMQEDKLTLARVSVTCFNETALHVAAMLGHVDFTQALLNYKRDLVTVLDSQGCSPLHLASANGYVEIVKLLLRADTSVCLIQDEDGRTPLHLAAMKGQLDVIKELVLARSEVTRYTLNRGETILQSCVMYNRLEALKLIVELGGVDCDFVNVKDDNGNTILHTATTLKRVETIKCLLSRTGVKVNAVNGNGLTALDVIEHMPRDLKSVEILELLLKAGSLRARSIPALARDTHQVVAREEDDHNESVAKHCEAVAAANATKKRPPSRGNSIVKRLKEQDAWLEKKRDAILVAATVIAAMAYQAGLNPPGGVWQADGADGMVAGESVMAAKYPSLYHRFWVFNTMSFIASLSVILLVVSGIPMKRKIFIWFLMAAMWVTMTFMAQTYLVSMQTITPLHEFGPIILLVNSSVYSWLGLIAIVFLVHTCRFFMWIIKKVRKCRKRSSQGIQINESEMAQDQSSV